MRNSTLGLVMLVASWLPCARGADLPERWTIDFDGVESGDVTAVEIARIAPAPVKWSDGFTTAEVPGRFSIVENSGHGRALAVTYPKGGVGPKQTGGQWVVRLQPRLGYTLQYRLRFSADFDWVQGGKLPGLAGGTAPTGGFFDPDGFTSRYMWRKDGKLVVYLYWAGQGNAARETGRQYGIDLDTGVTMERARDYILRQRVTMNTPGEPDGRLEVWVDGRLVLERHDLLFRNASEKSWQIDAFFFSTFHGGNDPSWAPSHECSAVFDEFSVEP